MTDADAAFAYTKAKLAPLHIRINPFPRRRRSSSSGMATERSERTMNPSVHTAEVLPARAVLFLGILAFHVLLAYLFATGLIRTTIQMLVPPMDVIPIPEHPVVNPPLPPQNPTFPPGTVIATVKPDFDINVPVDPTSEPLQTQTAVDPQPSPLAEPVRPGEPPLRLVGRNVMPNTEDYYPARDRRDGNEGTTEVRSCVNANGRLDGSPTVESSSGRESLDNAAVRVARDGRYAKAMRGETPVPNCYRFRVTFTMH
jgi:protein TonB